MTVCVVVWLNQGMANRTLPRNFRNELANYAMDQLCTAYGIAYERACDTDPGSPARARWQNTMAEITEHVIFERGFRIYRIDAIGPWIYEKLGVA